MCKLQVIVCDNLSIAVWDALKWALCSNGLNKCQHVQYGR